MLKAREAVQKLDAYLSPLAGRPGLRLDLNENTAGCSPRVLARLRELTTNEVGYYREREPMEAAVAAHLGLTASEVLLTNGADEAIHLLCETFLEPGDEALLVVPGFTMYDILAGATGARIVEVPAGNDFQFPFQELAAKISPRTRLIAIANPNNPTGTVAASAELLEIARRATDAAVLIDEAYFEFYGQTLLGEWRSALPNLFVARTFSKAYGMAGLRIGMLAGNDEHISLARRVTSPFNVNAVALACLPAALADDEYVRQYVDQVRKGRESLRNELLRWGIQSWESHANFVLAKIGAAHEAFVEGMERRGVLVRDRSRDRGCEGCVRISIGKLEDTARLLGALRATLAEIGITEAAAK
jgi:histidinol-phosphate aminotransferase